jgi:diaminopimelate decarboxylase
MLDQLKWLNLGGGHHITRADYRKDDLVALLAQIAQRHGVQVYIEPGEAIALDAGILVGEILDTFENGLPVAITDISATCHMPDVIEAPYRPAMLDECDPYPSITCGTNRARFLVTTLSSSRMPMPAGSLPTIQAPTTGRLPSNSGGGW